MTGILFRLLQEDDIDHVNAFYNNYHKAGRTREKFLWEFNECPHGKGIYILALNEDNGAIIGIQAGIPIIFINANGEEILTVKSEDTLLDIDACAALGRRDVFKDLYTFFIEECRNRSASCIWGFTWVLRSLQRVGCDVPFRVGQKILVLKPSRSYRFLSKLNPKNTLWEKLMIILMVLVSRIKSVQTIFTIFDRTSLKMDEFILCNTVLFKEISGNTQVVFIKQDEQFMRWRLKENPYKLDYQVLNFTENASLRAQVVFSLNQEGQAYIEQMLFAPGLKTREKRSMIKSVVKRLQRLNASHIRFMVFDRNKINREESELLTCSGFLSIKPGMGFIFKNLDDQELIKPDQILFSRLFTQGHA